MSKLAEKNLNRIKVGLLHSCLLTTVVGFFFYNYCYHLYKHIMLTKHIDNGYIIMGLVMLFTMSIAISATTILLNDMKDIKNKDIS